MEIDIQVDAAGRPSNLAAGGWGHANGEASVKFTMPGAQKILINHCNLFVLCSGPIAFKIKVKPRQRTHQPGKKKGQTLNTLLRVDDHAVLKTSEPEGTRPHPVLWKRMRRLHQWQLILSPLIGQRITSESWGLMLQWVIHFVLGTFFPVLGGFALPRKTVSHRKCSLTCK